VKSLKLSLLKSYEKLQKMLKHNSTLPYVFSVFHYNNHIQSRLLQN